jgi:hypothetical protein
LRDILANGAMPQAEIIDRAEAEGFSERTLRRARKNLGIQPTKDGYQGPWIWALSSKVAKKAKGVQHTNGDTFGEVGHLCTPPEEEIEL